MDLRGRLSTLALMKMTPVPQTLLQSYFKRMMFVAWRDEINGRMRAGLMTEVARLKATVGRREESIWLMKKEDLIQCAYRELGMSRTTAQQETMVTLRERIRQARALREAVASEVDPLTQVPKGLERMCHADLLLECEKRGISTLSQTGKGHRGLKSRPNMIVDIKDYVDANKQRNVVPPPTTTAGAIAKAASSAKAPPVVQKRAPPETEVVAMSLG